MDRPRTDVPVDRSAAELADAHDLRSVITTTLASTPIDEQSLRRGVWTYVDAERRLGTSPGHVILALTELVGGTATEPVVRQALLRQVILWSVEAYFGQLGGASVGRDGDGPSDSAAVTWSS